jgi:hypothetical protein
VSTNPKKIKIFVASPGDVQKERDQLTKVIGELNLTITAIAPEKSISLELIKWETHVAPGLGKGPQDVVKRQIGNYDIFIGILWKRMGTPTTNARSGTDEEFQNAYKLWQNDNEFPILFYFCQHPSPPPRTIDEVRQLGRVVAFRNELTKKGLVTEYSSHEEFADVIRPQLILAICKRYFTNDFYHNKNSYTTKDNTNDFSSGYHQLKELAQEYERTRASMESSDERTRALENIFSKMRTLALSSTRFLSSLANSISAGERLAAIAILQVQADSHYLQWLAERLRTENEAPFIGYHAAVAILKAVRSLYHSHADELNKVIEHAKKGFNANKASDRFAVLAEAQNELQNFLRKKKVYLSYDINDKRYKDLLRSWDANLDFAFEVINKPLINEWNKSSDLEIKQIMIKHIYDADYMLVIIGKATAENEIVIWEIEKAISSNVKIAAIKINKDNPTPSILSGLNILTGFDNENIIHALKQARLVN